MTAPLMELCSGCSGKGIVPHIKRKMENGEDDPADFKVHSLCERCGGSGKVALDKTRVKEPGNIVEQVG